MTEHNGTRCCCTCKYLAIDCSHPDTDGESIVKQRGWVCLAPEFAEEREGRVFTTVFSGWTKHGMCEMHDPCAAAMAESESKSTPNR